MGRDESIESAPRFPWWAIVVLVLAGLIAYWNSFDGAFTFDDDLWILNDTKIRSFTPFSKFFIGDRRPVVTLSLAVNYALGERDTWGYHLVNLMVHLLSGLTLFGLIRGAMLTESMRPRFGRLANRFAFAVSLLWIVHPLGTQSVTYIIQRAESMMGLFFLLTLYCAARAASTQAASLTWKILAVFACALGVACKAVIITAPILVLLYDVVFLTGSYKESLRRRWGLYVALSATLLLLIPMGVVGGVIHGPENKGASVGFQVESVTPWAYFRSQPGVLLHYLKLSFIPAGQCLDYGWLVADSVLDYGAKGLVILALLSVTAWALIRKSWPGFVGAWFFLILAPTSSVIPIKDLAYEHRMYLPLAGVTVLAVSAAIALARRVPQFVTLPSGVRNAIGMSLLMVIATALTATTLRRNTVYASGLTLWADVVAKCAHNPRGHYNLGEQLIKRDRQAEALARFEEAIALDAEYTSAHFNKGKALQELGRYDEAMNAYRRAVETDPTHAKAHLEIGNLHRNAGRHQEALESFIESVRRDPAYAEAHFNVGVALLDLARFDDAVDALAQAATMDPADAVTLGAVGYAEMKAGRLTDAETTLKRAIAMDPTLTKALYHMGQTQAQLQRPEVAITYYRRAIAAGLNSAAVHTDIGLAYFASGDSQSAADSFASAVQRNPNYAMAYFHLGNALASLGRYDEGVNAFERLLSLRPNHAEGRQALQECLRRRDGGG